MTTNYTPDRWVLIRVSPDDYRVFATWGETYLEGESWRVNSGVVEVECGGSKGNTEFYDVSGNSPKTYRCYLNRYGVTGAFCKSVLKRLTSKVGEVMTEEEAIAAMEVKI